MLFLLCPSLSQLLLMAPVTPDNQVAFPHPAVLPHQLVSLISAPS